MRPRIIFMVGGHESHPANAQAQQIIAWLGAEYACHTAEGRAAFEHLNECDLLVLMGQHWTGLHEEYRSPSEAHRRNFEKYVQGGHPIVTVHSAISSYDDWTRFAELVGFEWLRGVTSHSPLGEFDIDVLNTGHPIIEGVSNYRIHDELYCDVGTTPGMEVQVHAQATWAQRRHPMIMTAVGGRMAGAGKTTFLANGHDRKTYLSPALQQIWINTVRWSLSAE
jgi:type 1 glutamine amidotransferase